jgi:hypothetical protein
MADKQDIIIDKLNRIEANTAHIKATLDEAIRLLTASADQHKQSLVVHQQNLSEIVRFSGGK